MKKLKKKPLGRVLFVSVLMFNFISCGEVRKEKPREGYEEVKPPEQIIPIAQAKDMYDNYTNRRVPLIQHYEDSINGYREKFDVARYVVYDYATIKQYIAYIEKEAKLANADISALRFYFSNYPDKAVFYNGDSIVHPRQNSILLSPTVKKGDRDYLFYIGNLNGKPVPILLDEDFGPADKGIGLSYSIKGKAHASFAPSLNTTSPPTYQSGKSVTMNSGSGAPPPHY